LIVQQFLTKSTLKGDLSMRKAILLISTSLLFLCILSPGMAFDNHRKGFIIGGLGGVGMTSWEELNDGVKVDDGSDLLVHTDFRIGAGFGDRVMLYTWLALNWGEHYSFFGGEAMSIYFNSTSPSIYISFGLGQFSGWRADSFFPGEESELALMAGIGYEFAPHWSTEVNIMSGNSTVNSCWILCDPVKLEANIFVITLSIIGIAY
jgi:hypothetical protein